MEIARENRYSWHLPTIDQGILHRNAYLCDTFPGKHPEKSQTAGKCHGIAANRDISHLRLWRSAGGSLFRRHATLGTRGTDHERSEWWGRAARDVEGKELLPPWSPQGPATIINEVVANTQ